MSEFTKELIEFVLGNIPFLLWLLALVIGLVSAWIKRTSFSSEVIRWTLLLPVGIGGIWGFIMHAFFAEMAARLIGWAPSPFQFEVAVSNLGLGLVGIVGFFQPRPFWTAALIYTAAFLWGAAWGHLREMIEYGNFSPGNAGLIFYSDLLIPLTLLLAWLRQQAKPKKMKSK